MNDGVKLLLERIKTHPEEFVTGSGGLFNAHSRWQLLVQSYEGYLTPDDRQALRDAMNAVMAEKFTEAVMKELMGAEDDDPLGKSQQAQNMRSGGATLGQATSPYQQSLMAQAQMTQMQQAQLGALSSATMTVSTAGRTVWANEDTKKPWKRLKDWLGV